MTDRQPETETAIDKFVNDPGDPADSTDDGPEPPDLDSLYAHFRMRRELITEAARVIRALGQVLANIPEMGGELTDARVRIAKTVERLAKRAEKLMFTVED